MKNVLLTTTALVAFAGAAAAADVALTYSGSAEAGYDFDVPEFYATAEMGIDLTLTQELNNGAVASLALGGFADWDLVLGDDVTFADPSWVAMLETSYGSISAGDITTATDGVFTEVAGMDVDTDAGTDDTTGTIDFASGGAHILRADTTLGGYTIAASTNVAGDDVAATVSGAAGGVDFVLLYDTNAMGLNASGDFSGVSFAAAYATDGTDTSMGLGLGYAVSDAISVSASYANSTGLAVPVQTAVGVAYAAGGITASADYDIDAAVLDLAGGYTTEIQAGTTVAVGVTVDDATGVATVGYTLDVAYMSGDLGVYAGYEDDGLGASGMYVGANYDLGGGASAFIHSVDAASDGGPLEWAGAKVGVAMTF